MKPVFRLISFVSLAGMFGAAGLAFAGTLDAQGYRVAILIGTAGWFATVPFWMHRRLHHPPE